MPLRATYFRGVDLRSAADEQFSQNGLLLAVEERPELSPFSKHELEVVAPGGGCVRVSVEVLQILPNLGVAVSFDGADPELAELVSKSEGLVDDDRDPQFEWADTLEKPKVKGGRREGARENAFVRVKSASQQEKVQMAMHGSKAERAAILRDPNKLLHQYVIRNPAIQIDEVVAIARMPTIAPDVLKFIAEKREWYQRTEVAAALVRNPRLGVPLAVRVLKFVSKSDLRQIAKGNSVRMAVASAARKLLLR